jgi:hypothetical protein
LRAYIITSQTIELTSTMALVIAVTMKLVSTLSMAPSLSHGHSGEIGKKSQHLR